MTIDNIFPDPVSMYRVIKKEIPSLKNKNKDIMNKICSLNKSSNFWWAITGEYAIIAQAVRLRSAKDPRIIIDLHNAPNDNLTIKKLSTVFYKIIGIDFLHLKENSYNELIDKPRGDQLLFDDEKEHFSQDERKEEITAEKLPFTWITTRLSFIQYYFLSFLNLYKKIYDKIRSILSGRPIKKLNFVRPSPESEFEFIFLSIVPKIISSHFPSWFVYISEKIVSNHHKWITRFGFELNIFQSILIATSYEKFGEDNISLIPHGSVMGDVDFWHLYRFSLFPKTKLNMHYQKILTKSKNPKLAKSLLFCPLGTMWIPSFISLPDYRALMKVHKKTVEVLLEGLKKGKNIKIKYKDFKYLEGHAGQITVEETEIPVETGNFEDIFDQYSIIVTVPYGTISSNCDFNKIPFLSYHQPISPTDRQTHLSLCKNNNVITDEHLFLEKLRKIIDNL